MHVPLLTVYVIGEDMRTVGGQKPDGYVAADSSPIAILPMPPSWSPDACQYRGRVKEKTNDIPYCHETTARGGTRLESVVLGVELCIAR